MKITLYITNDEDGYVLWPSRPRLCHSFYSSWVCDDNPIIEAKTYKEFIKAMKSKGDKVEFREIGLCKSLKVTANLDMANATIRNARIERIKS